MPLDPGSLRAVKVGNENQRGPNLSGVAESLMTPTIRQGSFDGAAEGMDALGQGLADLGQTGARIAAVISDANARKQEHHDDGEIARKGLEYELEIEKFKGTLGDKPESEYLSLLDAELPKIRERVLKDAAFSKNGEGRFALAEMKLVGETRRGVQAAANRQQIERDTRDLLALADRHNEAGQKEEAAATLGKLVDRGAIGRDQMQSKLKQWADDANTNTLTGIMQGNPKEFHEDIVDFIKTGENKVLEANFTGPDKAIQLQKWEQTSGQYLRQVQAESSNALDDAILKGAVTTPEQIRAATSAIGLDEKDTQSFIASLAVAKLNTPEGQAKYLSNYDSLWTRSVNYDPMGDADGKKQLSLLRDIRSQAIEGERKPLLDNLREAIKDGMTPERQRAASLENTIDLLATQKLLIAPPDEKTATEAEKAAYIVDLNTKKSALKNAARKRVKDAPGIDAAKDSEWLKETINPMVSEQAAARMGAAGGGGSWMDWIPTVSSGGMGMGMLIGYPQEKPKVTPDQINEKLKSGKPMTSVGVPEPLLEAVKGWESFNPNAYGDYKQTSSGYGTRAKPGDAAISKQEADKRLREELADHANNVDSALKETGMTLTANQRAALISFDFNTGEGARLIKTSDGPEEIAARMPTFNKVTVKGKKVLSSGLVNRRKKELALFNS